MISSLLATADCHTKNIRVGAIVVAELKFGDVQRQIFIAYLVKRADHAALEDRPKAFNRVRVDRTDHVLPDVVLDALVRILLQVLVNLIIVGRQQANLVGNDLTDERLSMEDLVKITDAHHRPTPVFNIVTAKDGSYTVSMVANAYAPKMSMRGFASEIEAQDWIDSKSEAWFADVCARV